MATETELKIEVGDLQLLDCILTSREIRQRQKTDFSYVQMQVTYFDTEDELLSQNGQMLRLRKENGRSVITLKTRGEGYSRGEWEVEGEILEDAISALLKLGAPKTLEEASHKELLPLGGAGYTRILTELELDDATRVFLCGDLGEVFAAKRHAPLCELELELIDGSEEQMLRFGKTLMETYRLKEGTKSKFAQAKALREQ